MFRVAVYYLLLSSFLIVRNSYAFAPAQQARVLKGASPSGSTFPFKKSAISKSLFMSTSPDDRVAELKAAAAKAREDAERLSAELKQSKEEPTTEKKPAESATQTTAVSVAPQQKTAQVAADGTFYDDEIEFIPQKDGISDSMKARLMKEASTGLDSESKQTNTILYISAAVAVLVLIGGSGILF